MSAYNSATPRDPDEHTHAHDVDEDEAKMDEDFDPAEYDLTLHLEQLESLEEEMEELGVTTLAEVRQRIKDLHDQLG
ncbi:MAG: hypothetical protein ABI068_01695 [Ktedonobacterales bacterium]